MKTITHLGEHKLPFAGAQWRSATAYEYASAWVADDLLWSDIIREPRPFSPELHERQEEGEARSVLLVWGAGRYPQCAIMRDRDGLDRYAVATAVSDIGQSQCRPAEGQK